MPSASAFTWACFSDVGLGNIWHKNIPCNSSPLCLASLECREKMRPVKWTVAVVVVNDGTCCDGCSCRCPLSTSDRWVPCGVTGARLTCVRSWCSSTVDASSSAASVRAPLKVSRFLSGHVAVWSRSHLALLWIKNFHYTYIMLNRWIDDIILILQQNRLRWYGHVLGKEDTDWVKKCMEYEVEGSRPRGRPTRTWK